MSELPLNGVKVLDMSRVLSGPYGAMILADLGADVVKVERPGRGDDTRGFGPPFFEGLSTYYASINRGKRSIALNLKDPDDKEILLQLTDVADVLLANFRPGVMERLGLGYEALRARNPGLVYCVISGFGRGNPTAGYDLMIQGLSGIPSITGSGDQPWKCGASIADLVAGMNAVQGILAALYRRARTGEGALVDISMIDGQLALLTYHATGWLNGGTAPLARGNAHSSIHPYQSYRVADGWVNLAVGNDALFGSFCRAVGADWHKDPRFATNPDRVQNRAALNALLEHLMAGRTVAEWTVLLREAGVPGGPLNTVPQALELATLVEHPHPSADVTLRTVASPLQIDDLPRANPRRPPRLGEHRDEVIEDWLT